MLLRLPKVIERTGLPRSTIYLLMANKKFPRPIPLESARSVAWIASEVNEWVLAKVRAARGGT
jgi:prophage regulatory protein